MLLLLLMLLMLLLLLFSVEIVAKLLDEATGVTMGEGTTEFDLDFSPKCLWTAATRSAG